MARPAVRRSPAHLLARTLPGAKAAPHPGFVEPCLATLRTKAPAGERWIHEIKWDGYRFQLHLRAGKPTLSTRRGNDWTNRLRSIAEAAASLGAKDLVLDGEVVVPGRGSGDFEGLQDDLGAGRSDRFVYHAFDILYLDGFDLRPAPLIERKRVLAELLDKRTSDRLQYVEHLEDEDGERVHRNACAMGLEGVVSKLRDAPYRSGRGDIWIKTKCTRRGRFVVVGFDPAPGSIAALRLGREKDGRLVYAGKVGTGLRPRRRQDPPRPRPAGDPEKPAYAPDPKAQGEMGRAGVRGGGGLPRDDRRRRTTSPFVPRPGAAAATADAVGAGAGKAEMIRRRRNGPTHEELAEIASEQMPVALWLPR